MRLIRFSAWLVLCVVPIAAAVPPLGEVVAPAQLFTGALHVDQLTYLPVRISELYQSIDILVEHNSDDGAPTLFFGENAVPTVDRYDHVFRLPAPATQFSYASPPVRRGCTLPMLCNLQPDAVRGAGGLADRAPLPRAARPRRLGELQAWGDRKRSPLVHLPHHCHRICLHQPSIQRFRLPVPRHAAPRGCVSTATVGCSPSG